MLQHSMVVTFSFGGFVADQMRDNLESAHYNYKQIDIIFIFI